MNQIAGKRRSPGPKKIRTNSDWVMVMIGVCLIIFFLIAGYVGLGKRGEGPTQKKRGPVKDPTGLGLKWGPGTGEFLLDDFFAALPGCKHKATSTTAFGQRTSGRSGYKGISQMNGATVPFA